MRRTIRRIETGKRHSVRRSAWSVATSCAVLLLLGYGPAVARPIRQASSVTIGTAPIQTAVPRLSIVKLADVVVERGVHYPLNQFFNFKNAQVDAQFSVARLGPSTVTFWQGGSVKEDVAFLSIFKLPTISFSADGPGAFQLSVVQPGQSAEVTVDVGIRAAPEVPSSGPTAPKVSVVVPPVSVTVATTPTSLAPPPTPAPVPTTVPNLAPVATSSNLIAQSGVAIPILLQGTDPENKSLTTALVQFPTHGRLSGQTPQLVYVADAGFVGSDAFTFAVSDGQITSTAAVVTVTVVGSTATTKKPIGKLTCRIVKGRKICTRIRRV